MKKLFYILTILILLASCHDEITVRPEPKPGQPELSDMQIDFTANLGQSFASSAKTRGTLLGTVTADHPNDDDGNQQWQEPWAMGDAFTAYALYYFDNMTTLGQQFMYGQEVNYMGRSTTPLVLGEGTCNWAYSPLKYWPQQGYLDLFAHYPSNEMLASMRLSGDMTTDPGLTLPDDMEEDSFVDAPASSPVPATRGIMDGIQSTPGLSSLRYWHENPLDTILAFRYYCLPSGLDAPVTTNEPRENDVPVTEYDDARYQPDLMFSHRPHIGKMATNAKLFMNFTHAMMGVRFWLKGIDDDDDNPSEFHNIGDFTINSISFGPVYSGGECIAYDNTNWAAYYYGLAEATQYSTEPVKLRYVWNYGESAPEYTAQVIDAEGQIKTPDYTMAPPYGGCERRIPWDINGVNAPLPLDQTYPVPTETDIFTQRCDFALSDYSGTYGVFSPEATKTDNGWMPPKSKPILPILHPERGETAEQSAFIIPPQIFKGGNPYIKVTYTLTELVDGDDIPETLTFTTGAVPISGSTINVEDGEILDIYFTFTIDGDDNFKFIVDAKVNPWVKGGEQKEEWTNW